jgi:hypothetical protein
MEVNLSKCENIRTNCRKSNFKNIVIATKILEMLYQISISL